MLRKLRTRAQYKPVQVAKKMQDYGFDITNTNISRWENGYNNPTLEQFLALCNLYGVDDLYAVFEKEDLSTLRVSLNRAGVEKLEEYRDLLLATGWFAEDNVSPQAADRRRPYSMHINEPYHRAHGMPTDTEPRIKIIEQGTPEEMSMPVHEVRLYTIGPSAGTANPFSDAAFEMMPLPKGMTADVDFAVLVDGDGMAPLIPAGSTVYVRSQPGLTDGDIAVVTVNNITSVRQFRNMGRDGMWLVPANTSFEALPLFSDDAIMIHGKVMVPHIDPTSIPFEAGKGPIWKMDNTPPPSYLVSDRDERPNTQLANWWGAKEKP